jgi:hypothetical protein
LKDENKAIIRLVYASLGHKTVPKFLRAAGLFHLKQTEHVTGKRPQLPHHRARRYLAVSRNLKSETYRFTDLFPRNEIINF